MTDVNYEAIFAAPPVENIDDPALAAQRRSNRGAKKLMWPQGRALGLLAQHYRIVDRLYGLQPVNAMGF